MGAYCVDTHVRAAQARGERQRLHMLAVWKGAPCYSERERAALTWCEEVTLIGELHASDEAYEEVARVFGEEEVVALTYLIVSINGFNRLAIAFRQPVAPGPVAHLKASRALVQRAAREHVAEAVRVARNEVRRKRLERRPAAV